MIIWTSASSRLDGKFHTAYETGIDTDWGSRPRAPVADSPIRSLLLGEVDHILTDDACTDPRFQLRRRLSPADP